MRKYEIKFIAAKWVIFRNLIIERKTVICAGNAYKAKKKTEREYKIWGFITPDWVSVQTVREVQ